MCRGVDGVGQSTAGKDEEYWNANGGGGGGGEVPVYLCLKWTELGRETVWQY